MLRELEERFNQALAVLLPPDLPRPAGPRVALASQPQFGDFQSNLALTLAKPLGRSPRAVAEALVQLLHLEDLCEAPEIAGPGFINLRLRPAAVARELAARFADPRLGVSPAAQPQRVIVDFSSPNIAKEMHVGHLRSTILGDALARLLSFLGHEVLRLNHVGDWGTQFGMLITHLQEAYPEALQTANVLALGDLTSFYKQAKARFDADPVFQEMARQAVVRLQAGDPVALQAWRLLCDQSRLAFQEIYSLLGITLTERGESFYNPYLAEVVADLQTAGLAVEDQGAICVFLDGFTNKDGRPQPLIIQKSDGGYNYATTDLAALRYRITQDGAQRLVYITDAGQASHFAQVFQVARRAGWVPEDVQLVHIPFGLVLGEDGKKFRTRSGDTVRLRDLLDEAIQRAKTDLTQRLVAEDRQESAEFIDHIAQVVGISAVKYADLSQNLTSNYVFSFDRMLALQGNTAPYMLYAYVRVQGISRKGQVDWQSLIPAFDLAEETELVLAKHLLQFPDVIQSVAQDLLPHRLCTYLFELSQKFNQFYDRCPVLGAEEPWRTSRLGLAHLTAQTLNLGLDLLGIPVVERM
ncbi:MAG: arginine--tRNA ligase [Gloeomargaritaceae cyanobacterium C42_A2020_066]|nr:arginine--tRNA ligase [Gloeomargaritaceae cyanobacterium C42_A2020_066]